jgi:NRAMP (natural resistance-associated macrophage protein)-like metal ion transporter
MRELFNRLVAAPGLRKLGPGLITGAADDDPSGIATYSQTGAQFGFGMLWTLLFAYPLMVGIQIVSARIGRVTGQGVAANLRRHYPPWLLYAIVLLLLIANTCNLAADIAAMAAALQLLIGGPAQLYAVIFGALSLLLQVFVPFSRYSPFLKWLTLSLFAYVAVVFSVRLPWREMILSTAIPPLSLHRDYVIGVVAVLGTTISPYLFFWQASHEVEELRADANERPLRRVPLQAPAHLQRIRVDTYVGMALTTTIAFFIMLTTAVTLHAHGITHIETAAQAAEALRPIAGPLAFFLFSVGIIGTGLLAVPVLAGSAAYAVSEALRLPVGLALKPREAIGFYSIIAAATLIGVALVFTPIDAIKALYWSAVINGVIAVPIMAVMMVLAAQPRIMGRLTISPRLQLLGWLATLVMGAAVVAMFITL